MKATLGVWALALALLPLAPTARADVAPPEVDACALLPAGSPCTTAGRARGECVAAGDAGRGVCRLVAKPEPVTRPSPAAASSAKPLRATAKRHARPSSSTGVCSATPDFAGGGTWTAALILLLARRRLGRGSATG